MESSPLETMDAYMKLMEFNFELSSKGLEGSLKAINDYHNKEMDKAFEAFYNTLFNLEGENINTFLERQAKTSELVAYGYGEAIKNIGPEFGFHFENGKKSKNC
jgi:hypothetical protein